jgi:hypothetical protein
VDGLRALMLRDAESVFGLGMDAAVLALAMAVLVVLAARLYGRMGN